MSCIFCKIVSGEIPSKKIYENEQILVIKDINPQAQVHMLIISKEHIKSANHLTKENIDVVGHMFLAAKEVAKIMNIDESGYRLINNCGTDGSQSVNHLHIHLLGGEKLGENLRWETLK